MIEVLNLSRHFGGLKAVDNASLRIETGSITGLIGLGEIGKALEILASGGSVNYQGATNVEFNEVGEVFGTYKELEIANGEWNTVKVH